MRREERIDDYLAHPFGAFFAGETFLHFFAEESLCGTVFWGRPDAAAIQSLVRAIEVESPSKTPRHRAFVDATRLTGIDPEAFRTLAEFVGPRAAEFGSNVIKQAIARPQGVLGAIVSGFYDVTPAVNLENSRLFTSPLEALAWLEVRGADDLLASLDEARACASGTPVEVRALHELVIANPRSVSIASVANALGLSPRVLQDRLRAHGTTYRNEVNAARVRAAQELLRSSDTKVSAIALEVGCASLQHFSTLFRKQTGQSPSEWRALYRR